MTTNAADLDLDKEDLVKEVMSGETPSKTEDGFMALAALAKQFAYLDELRESGVTNMFASPAYVRRAFRVSEKKAEEIVKAWMRTFSRTQSPEDRARAAISKVESKS